MLLVEVLTHVPPQLVWPDGQHLPLEHTSPTAQALPQAPQLFTSVEVVTQFLLQTVCPEGHVQVPLVQVWLVPQAFPHEPQLAPFVLVSTHTPLQAVWVGGHGTHVFVVGLQVPVQQVPLQQI